MFERLRIINFQNVTKAEIAFAPDCTTFVGPTDSGKTARLRALSWLMFNEPAGTAFVKQGQEDCQVALWLDNGRKITREVGPGHNVYKLDGKTYKAFGRGVPEDIAKLLNVGPVNVQDQITLPYFFCLSPGQVSKELNGVINLSVIDRTLSAAATESRKSRGMVEFSTSRLEKALAERDELAWVEECDGDLHELETLYTTITEQRASLDSAGSVLKSVSESRVRLQVLLNAKADALPLIELGAEIAQQRERIDTMQDLLDSCTQSRKKCAELSKALVKVENEIHELSQGACPLCGREWK